ncbi:divalent-cation tolerance protein CutA [Acidobacteriota bacterium]
MEEKAYMLFSTVDSESEALRMAKHVVDKKLAACVNIVPGIRSIYTWKGEVQDEGEFLLIFKTSGRAVEHLEKAVRSVHKYDLPEIITLEIDRGDPGYLAWIQDMTGKT